MQKVHLATKIQAMIGIVDDDGDLIERKMITMEPAKLNEDQFLKALHNIELQRDNFLKKKEKQCQTENSKQPSSS